MKNNHIQPLLAILLFLSVPAFSQTKLEGYVFEQNNRGFLNQAKVIVNALDEVLPAIELQTDVYGFFSTELRPGKYKVLAEKDIFFERTDTIHIEAGLQKVYLKMEMRRRPGYLFDATLAEMRESPDQLVDAIQGATIEIYNRTQKRPELVIENDNDAFFQFTFERGNHYTVLIRKEGYLAKRIEVYVNINGCILCVDGVRAMTPGVTENLTAGNEMGTLLANIELEKAKLDKRIQIQNIYYDYDKWDIRADASEQLDIVVQLMKDNPGLSVELGSHTDSRGNDQYNEELSQKRAQSAVAYIISEGVDSVRITAKGYGERALVNRCSNGVDCSEEDHQKNRRTELRITGIAKSKHQKSLEFMIMSEEMAMSVRGKEPKKRPANKIPTQPEKPVPPPFSEFKESPKEISPKPNTILHEFGTVHILSLPASFKGYAIELAGSQTSELSADNPVFQGQKDVFHRLENNQHSYYLVNLGSKDAALNYFKKKIKPNQSKARLVLFTESEKTYIDE
ncbi:MAG: OmpA family protein [Saprospiraceae bacterium]|nr:OmpA family protein [Saprospiraceae bacterium]